MSHQDLCRLVEPRLYQRPSLAKELCRFCQRHKIQKCRIPKLISIWIPKIVSKNVSSQERKEGASFKTSFFRSCGHPFVCQGYFMNMTVSSPFSGKIVTLLGSSGSGKSCLAQRYVQRVCAFTAPCRSHFVHAD
jgi:hypothetical protein